jgi:DNA invertase Pin-like site-specific DNA recombinase
MIRRVALYARVSTRDKDQDPDLQLVPLRAYAAAHGWAYVEVVDLAPAGDLRRRTAWRHLLLEAQQRRVDAILVWKLDRAFRSSTHAHATLADLDHHGVGFVSITQQFDTTSPTGRLVFAILAAVAEMERDLIGERVKEGMRLAVSKGVKVGRPSVTSAPTFQRRWSGVKAAKELRIGATTLRRLLGDGPKSEGSDWECGVNRGSKTVRRKWGQLFDVDSTLTRPPQSDAPQGGPFGAPHLPQTSLARAARSPGSLPGLSGCRRNARDIRAARLAPLAIPTPDPGDGGTIGARRNDCCWTKVRLGS